ncbi:MAG: Sec-independent protein translocase subunit TatA/TatB [Anaerolineales bacterium]
MDIGPTELLIILFIVVLIFGPGRLSKIGGELGKSIRSFREGLTDLDEGEKSQPTEEDTDQQNSNSQNRIK